MYHPLPAYLHFLQPGEFNDPHNWRDTDDSTREEHGLQAILRCHFPIEREYQQDGQELIAQIEFVSYRFEAPRNAPATCRAQGTDYAAPLKLTIRLLIWEVEQDGTRQIQNIKEQEIYFGEIPWMTDEGTFIIEGIEVILLPQVLPVAEILAHPDHDPAIDNNNLTHQQVRTADVIIAQVFDAALAQITKTTHQRLSRAADPDYLMPSDLFSTKTLGNQLRRLLVPSVKSIPQAHLMIVASQTEPNHQCLIRPSLTAKLLPYLRHLYLQAPHPSHEDRLVHFDADTDTKMLPARLLKLAPGATIDAAGAIQPATTKPAKTLSKKNRDQPPKERPPKDPKCLMDKMP